MKQKVSDEKEQEWEEEQEKKEKEKEEEEEEVHNHAFFVLDLGFHILNRVRRLHIERDGLAGQSLDENLHRHLQEKQKEEATEKAEHKRQQKERNHHFWKMAAEMQTKHNNTFLQHEQLKKRLIPRAKQQEGSTNKTERMTVEAK